MTFSGATATGKNFVALEENNTIYPANFGEIVNLQFSRLLSRVRVAFYEDMEDWEVKNIDYSLSGTFVSQGDYRIVLSDGSFTASNITSYASIDKSIDETIGDSIETAKDAGFTEILPYHNTSDITLTLHRYTFVDPVGREEYVFSPETKVVIPAAKAAWDMNQSYTYIFRISEARVTFDLSVALNIHDWDDNDHETILE